MNQRIALEQVLGWSGFFLSALFILGLAVFPMH
jgi:hypothetical protein